MRLTAVERAFALVLNAKQVVDQALLLNGKVSGVHDLELWSGGHAATKWLRADHRLFTDVPSLAQVVAYRGSIVSAANLSLLASTPG